MSIRIATYNASLSREQAGKLLADIHADHPQILGVIKIVQLLDADVLLINEIDYDHDHAAIQAFIQRLNTALRRANQPTYSEYFAAPVNTGMLSPIDFNQDGYCRLPHDGFGFGRYPGQYGMALLSRLPIDHSKVRTFQHCLWKDLPNATWPHIDGQSYFSEHDKQTLRLSSKSHWDVPIFTQSGHNIHCLCSHPTPPAFDGAEKRNVYRNAAEIDFWTQYLHGWSVRDDQGRKAALQADHYVLMGDLNNDAERGNGCAMSIRRLCEDPSIIDPKPYAARFTTKNPYTANFGQNSKMRVDYVLPSAQLSIQNAGVLWPARDDPYWPFFSTTQGMVSDHYPVWVDIAQPTK